MEAYMYLWIFFHREKEKEREKWKYLDYKFGGNTRKKNYSPVKLVSMKIVHTNQLDR